MYRAKVEAVDGLKVRAGGKWLTCIGNRVVRAGDMIWTDGRCVYGHDREPQTPIVIANPPKDTPYIPISTNPVADLLSSWGKGQRHLYTDKLNFIDESFDEGNDYNGQTYGKCVTAGRSAVYFEWYSRRLSFSGDRQVIWTPAINVDKEENIYTLSYELTSVSSNGVDYGDYPVLQIKKNGKTLSTISTESHFYSVREKTIALFHGEIGSGKYITKLRTPRQRLIVGRRENMSFESSWMHREPNEDDGTWVYTEGISDYYLYELGPRLARENTNIVMEWVDNFVYRYPISEMDEYSPRVTTTVMWSFIENENHWAMILSFQGVKSITVSKPTELSDPISKNTLLYMTSYLIDDPVEVDIDARTHCTYLISNDGAKLLSEATELERYRTLLNELPECEAVREKAGLPPLSYGSLEGLGRWTKTFNMSGYFGLTLPMQDGFYYKINKPIDISGGDITHPALIDVTIYAPSDKPIFSGIFFSDSYLAACRIKLNTYLISVRTLGRAYPYQDEEWDKYKSLVVRRGLYLCQGETLEKISDKVIENQSLRSSKIFKKWDGTLQRVPK